MDFRPLSDYEIGFVKGLQLDVLVDDLVVCEHGRDEQASRLLINSLRVFVPWWLSNYVI